MPFFDKNRDKAAYVLISFSRNVTARRLESSIAHLRVAGQQHAIHYPQILNTSEKYENDDNQQRETYASGWDVAPLPAVRPPRQRAQECQDQKDHQDSSQHCFSPSVVNSAVDARLVQIETDRNALAWTSPLLPLISAAALCHSPLPP